MTQKTANGSLRDWNQDATFAYLSITSYLFIYSFIFYVNDSKKDAKKVKALSHITLK